jgi:hypothetical protein
MNSVRMIDTQVRATAEFSDLTVVELDIAIGEMVITVVVRDDNDGLALGLKLRQQLLVEHFLESRILVGGPFVEDIERPVRWPCDKLVVENTPSLIVTL